MSQRKVRGIRCSRLKLDAALASSDIPKKTQIALAEAIADAEELESVPKDLVSKMFRELPVDPQTIERVAKVLGVSAASLYLEDNDVTQESEAESSKSRKSRLVISSALLVLIVFVTSLFLIQKETTEDDNCYNRMTLGGTQSSQNSISVVIARLTGDQDNQAQLMLATRLASDQRLKGNLEVFTSCMEISFGDNKSIREQIISGHKKARQELKHYNAQLVIWGERYDDRVNLRFTSNGPEDQPKRLTLADKTIQTNEIDFSFTTRLDDEETLSGDIQLVILNMLSPIQENLVTLKEQLIDKYNYLGSWLKEAVISDTNLLQRISKSTNPNLYGLTLTQLCFRRRLLGDLEASDQEYQLADEACNEALEFISKEEAPIQWASIKGNLATLTTRRYLYAKTIEERVSILEQARAGFTEVEPIYARLANPNEAATFYQNYTAVYIRLAEVQPANALELLEKAQQLSIKSLSLGSADNNPLYYAQRLQNQCVLKYRIGAMKQSEETLLSAVDDCKAAKATISSKDHPAKAAMILNNLAVSYAIMAEVKKDPDAFQDAFQQALGSFDNAQQIYTKEQYPLNWGEVEINKAELKCKLSLVAKDKNWMGESRKSAEAALLIFVQKGVEPYQKYAENLISKIQLCNDLPIEDCQCSS